MYKYVFHVYVVVYIYTHYNNYIIYLSFIEGTTLRNYLSKVLNCDPMRITKKYTGNNLIGERTFRPLSIKNE